MGKIRSMNEQDYIKAAVELADGWTYHDGDCSHEETERWFIGCKLPQVWLDALAAQLVRQIPKPYGIWQYPIGVSISSMDLEDGRELSKVEGPDRTMNTIKAIVDSKVLK